MKQSVLRIALLTIALVSCVFPLSARATLAPYNGIGGDGGAPFRVDCGESGILVGLIGRSGVVVDQAGGLCVKVDPISGTWIGGVYETPRLGGNGGGTFRKICPVGQALMGIEGNTNYFDNVTVVGSLDVKCIDLGIAKAWNGPQIMGTRMIFNGDPEPYKVKAIQDYCEPPQSGDGHNKRVWGRIGLALEGRSGKYLDRVHLVCGTIAQDKAGYRVEFRSSAKTAVPEGTPLQISWRASGVKPELTPNLQYSWELVDATHTQTSSGPFGGFPQPTRIQNPCAYALQPCAASWVSVNSGSSIIFNGLPPAVYELRLSVRPTVSPSFAESSIESQATAQFEVAANQLAVFTLNPNTIKAAGASTATITLEGVAPPRGITVYLSSSNPQAVGTPAFIVVPSGKPSGTIGLRADPKLLGGGQVQITASLRRPLNLQAASEVQLRSSSVGAQTYSGTVSNPAAPTNPGTPSAGATVQTDNPPSATQQLSSAQAVSVLTQANRISAQLASLPSDTKQATLTIQSAVAIQPSVLQDRRLLLGR